MPAPANLVRARLGSWGGNADDRLYARATPEKVEIAETYSVTQEISKSPWSEPGTPTGRIEMVIPYDGGDYFTRQAGRDVDRAVAARGQAGQRGFQIRAFGAFSAQFANQLLEIGAGMWQSRNVAEQGGVRHLPILPVPTDNSALTMPPYGVSFGLLPRIESLKTV